MYHALDTVVLLVQLEEKRQSQVALSTEKFYICT